MPLITQSDVSAVLLRKSQIQERANPSSKSNAARLLEKTRIIQMRNLAMKRNDRAEVAVLDKQLEEILATIAADPTFKEREPEVADIMAKVNERNRKANQEAMRLAAQADAERKRKERQAALTGAGNVPIDPSARLKTVPRMFASRFVPSAVFLCLIKLTPCHLPPWYRKDKGHRAMLLLCQLRQALSLLFQAPHRPQVRR